MNRVFIVILFFLATFIICLPEYGYSQKNKGFGRKTYQVRTWGKKNRNVIAKAGSKAGSRSRGNDFDMSFGLSLGVTNSFTDIGGTGAQRSPLFLDVQFSHTHLAYGAFYRMMFSETFGLTAMVGYDKLSGVDTLSPKTSGRYWRNKNFDNSIIEFGVKAEYFLPYRSDMSFISQGCELAYYAFVGVAGFTNNPDLKGTIDEYDLQMSVLNGDNPYSTIQLAIPVGAGILFNITDVI